MKNSDHSNIYRVLALRITLAAVVIAGIFATISLVTQRGELENALGDLVRLRMHAFNYQLLPVIDTPGGLDPKQVQAKLESFASDGGASLYVHGKAVVARIYDENSQEIARLSDASYPGLELVESVMDAGQHLPPDLDGLRSITVSLEGAPYVGVAVPLVNSNKEMVAHAEVVFSLSPSAAAKLKRNTLRTVFYVIAIVLVTALIIYPIIRGLLAQLVRYSDELLEANLETMLALGGAIAKRDSDTDAHNYRVSIYSVRLAEEVGLSDNQIQSLIKGALLHDVGKVGIRDDILLKPGKLDEQEFDVMKTHVKHGIDITSRAKWLSDGQPVVGGHHEKFDGSGYPGGQTGEAIPILARIFAIADVFDALTSKRPYKEPFSLDKTMQILEDSRGSHFDPGLLDAFTQIAEKLYKTYSGEENDTSKEHLGAIITHYFH
ncbi:MAG: HD-GYP domain-containing protein [Porticoccus sp.]|nr:HD-GYP domain-containing protein [Porticoccus sp.]